VQSPRVSVLVRFGRASVFRSAAATGSSQTTLTELSVISIGLFGCLPPPPEGDLERTRSAWTWKRVPPRHGISSTCDHGIKNRFPCWETRSEFSRSRQELPSVTLRLPSGSLLLPAIQVHAQRPEKTSFGGFDSAQFASYSRWIAGQASFVSRRLVRSVSYRLQYPCVVAYVVYAASIQRAPGVLRAIIPSRISGCGALMR